MDKRGQRDRVVEMLYSAAVDEADWTQALEELAGFTSTRVITLDTYDFMSAAGEVSYSSGIPHRLVVEYNENCGQRNELIEAAEPHFRNGAILFGSDMLHDRDLRKTDLYQLIYRPLGIHHACGVCLESSLGWVAQYTFLNDVGYGDFRRGQIKTLRSLKPHLARAYQTWRHLREVGEDKRILARAWDRLDHAVVIMDRKMKIRFANRAAENLFRTRSPVATVHGRLLLRDERIQADLRQSLSRPLPLSRTCRSFRLANPSGGPDLSATLFMVNARHVGLLISDFSRPISPDARSLTRFFHLTAQEARVLVKLVGGQSLREIAASMDIRYETVRSHLKNAMTKNGWHSQGHLISEILGRMLPLGLIRET